MSADRTPAVRLRGVTKRFPGVLAVDGVDLEILSGEVHVVAGENGAGKSTLMKLLSQVERPDEGTVEIAGEPVAFHGPGHAQRLGVAMVYQEFALAPHLTVAENLFLGREPGRFGTLDRGEERRRARELLASVRLDVDPGRRLASLPVAAQQRVEIAKALAIDAKLVIMDELGKAGGDIAFIPFQRGTTTNEQRAEGFKRGLKEHPELKLVAEQASQSDYDKALQVTEDILTANPNLKGIFAANEPGVLGAAEAVRQAKKSGKITIVGWDASPDEVKGVRDGVIDALIVQNPFRMGFDGVNAITKQLREGTKPASGDTGVTIVTKSNLDDPEVKAVLKPSCDDPPS